MAVDVEKIGFQNNEFFRVFRWEHDAGQAGILQADGTFAPVPGKGRVWHLHDETELTLITHGAGTRFVGDHVCRFAAPSLVLLGPNLPHCWRYDGDSFGLCVQWSAPRLAAALPLAERSEVNLVSERSVRGLTYSRALSEPLSDRLHQLVHGSGLSRIGTMLQLISDLAGIPASGTRELSSQRFSVSRMAPGYESIQHAILLILAHFRDPLTLKDVLAEAHMSKANFSRRFVVYTGKTYTEFLNEVRINDACQRLADTGAGVSDIAFASGYNNLAHFHRMFRRYRGVAPTEYRDQIAPQPIERGKTRKKTTAKRESGATAKPNK